MKWTDLKFDVRIHNFKIQAYLAARPNIRIEGEDYGLMHVFFDNAEAAVKIYQAKLSMMRDRNPDMTEEQVREAALLKWWNELQGNLAPSMPRFPQWQTSPTPEVKEPNASLDAYTDACDQQVQQAEGPPQ